MNVMPIILYAALLAIGSSRAEGWKGIVPLHSSRVDVERLLGPPTSPCKSSCRYETMSEVLFVRYSAEPCDKIEKNIWRVPNDTVIDLTINLKRRPRLSELKLNLRKFKQTMDPELHGYSTYESASEGVAYAVSRGGRVYSIEWFASAKDDEGLRCRPGVTSPSSENSLLDRESVSLTFDGDKPRLDEFATKLKKTPDAKGYVIAYAGELGPARIATMRLKCIRMYFQKIHDIEPSRFVAIDGGYRSQINVELFLVRPNDPIPKPAPTRSPGAVHDVPSRTDPCK